MIWNHDVAMLLTRSGFTAWPLLLCSIIGAAVIIERTYYFLRLRLNYPRFSEGLFQLLRKRRVEEALLFCNNHPGPVAQTAFLYLENLDSRLREQVLSREASLAMEKVESRLRGLAAITHIAPLLGLLGTVTGMVSAFYSIELMGGQVQVDNLAGGIWEALLSTVFGLTVAIPCMAAYHGFESRADAIARRIQNIVGELDEFFKKDTSRNIFKTGMQDGEEIIKGAQ